jgi:hypothetical protein
LRFLEDRTLGALTAKSRALFSEVEAAIIAEIIRAGPERFMPAGIVGRFAGRGADRSTLFRWSKQIIDSGRPGQAFARSVKEAVAARAACPPSHVKEVEANIAAKLPQRASVDDAAGGVHIMLELRTVIAQVAQVAAVAKTVDGEGVRDPRLLLAASEAMRRCIETTLRLQKALASVDQVERFHALVLEQVRLESPECSERIFRRLNALASEWGG